MKQCTGILQNEALIIAAEIKKKLTSMGQWCNVTEINQPDLTYIKIEASIKVKE